MLLAVLLLLCCCCCCCLLLLLALDVVVLGMICILGQPHLCDKWRRSKARKKWNSNSNMCVKNQMNERNIKKNAKDIDILIGMVFSSLCVSSISILYLSTNTVALTYLWRVCLSCCSYVMTHRLAIIATKIHPFRINFNFYCSNVDTFLAFHSSNFSLKTR